MVLWRICRLNPITIADLRVSEQHVGHSGIREWEYISCSAKLKNQFIIFFPHREISMLFLLQH